MPPEGFVFDEAGVKRIVAAVRRVEKIPADFLQPRRKGGRSGGGGGIIYWGKPVEEFSAGETLVLDPCDIHGTDNGAANKTVYLQASKASYSMHNSTNIPTTAIVPYVVAADGNYYVVGAPKVVLTDFRDSGDDVNGIQVKTRDDFGLFSGTESDWVSGADTEAFACP